MSSESSVLGHLSDVAAILVLGTVYVALLSVGTVASYSARRISSIATSGKDAVGRVTAGARSPR